MRVVEDEQQAARGAQPLDLARAHARTGDPMAITGYLGGGPAFDNAVGAFARA